MRGWSITELQRIAEAEQTRTPFLCWLSQTGEQRLMVLDQSSVLTVGRRSSNNLVLLGDPEASRLHARLELIDQDWTITDDGLSRNGTFVNGARVLGRRRLKDGDWLRFGSTTVQYRAPYEGNTRGHGRGSAVPRSSDIDCHSAGDPDGAVPSVSRRRRVSQARDER